MLKVEALNNNKTLIVGSGGREDAIALTILRQNPHAEILMAPGNGGTPRFGRNLDIAATDIEGLARIASDERVGRTIVGPEAPLAKGVVNLFITDKLPIVGPTAEAAILESDKIQALRFMEAHGISHPASVVTQNPDAAASFVREFYEDPKNKSWGGLVIKYPGLAAGKGVTLPQNIEEARGFLDDIYVKKKFGEANELLFQEKLIGQELSLMFWADGKNPFMLLPARDYKAAFDGDNGSNTGGMGSYAPFKISKDVYLQGIDIARKTIDGMRVEKRPFKGTLYVGLMLVNGKLYVLEYNVRGGDSETQTIMPKFEGNLIESYDSIIRGDLRPDQPRFSTRGYSVTTVISAEDYPDGSSKGAKITLPDSLPVNVILNHAGTKLVNGELQTNGGRVANVTALAETASEAAALSNQYADKIVFDGARHRRDIAKEAA